MLDVVTLTGGHARIRAAHAQGAVPPVAVPAPGSAPVVETAGVTTASSATAVTPTPPARATAAAVGTGSPGATVVVDPANAWALLVGIGTYDSPTHPTFGGIGDVDAFHRLLNQAGWPDSHILVLTDQAATAGAIRSAMHWLVDHSSPSSFSVFHYSGHVNQAAGRDSLWGVDNNFIGSDEFGSDLGGLQGRAWIDVSGCEAAAFDSGLSSPSRFFTAASLASQKAYEMPSWRESVWTGLVIDQGMLQHGAGSGPISIQRAVRWAQPLAFSQTATQRPYGPQQPYARGGDGEWFVGPPAARQPGPGMPAPTRPVEPGSPPATQPVSGPPATRDGCAALTLGLIHCGS